MRGAAAPENPASMPARPAREGSLPGLFALLAVASFFEGFDTMLASLVLPQLGREFGAGPAELGRVLSALGLGAVFGFLPLRLADRFGRRPVFLFAMATYTSLCLATATSTTLASFTLYQAGARMAMVTEIALAYVMLSEESPPERRGRLNGLLGGVASAGAMTAPLLLPLCEALGFGWRGLYAIGGSLVALVPLYVVRLREPAAFAALPRPTLREDVARTLSLFGPTHRARLAVGTLAWFTVDFWNAAAMFFFSYYVQQERGWTPGHLAVVMPVGGIFNFAGYALAGRLMDRIGRKPTLILHLGVACLASALCFQARSMPFIVLGYFAMTAAGGMWSVVQTISTELFPTQLRATGTGVAHNLFGRFGMTLAPAAVGSAAVALGSTGDAVTILGLASALALPALARWLPETRGTRLDGAQPP